ncbi:S-layer homology domain-containing protein [Gorillibacterium massiliense]|uniref:S-layer homology domain-containing protein n=1 Tax=Gorillibacterium massiliense TaxID=1280390 RepID=UPI0004BBF189|nr:S-layer homology domain-containing protein [Gorillibacterium massiliense]
MSKGKKTGNLFILIFVVILLSTQVQSVSAAAAIAKLPQIRIELSSAHVEVGESFEAAVWLQGFTGDYGNLQGYEIHIAFNPALVKPADDQGQMAPNVFRAEDSPMSLLNKVDKGGEISIAQTLTQKTKGLFSGYGKVATLRFVAIKAGNADFKLTKSIVIKPDNPGVNIKHMINSPTLVIGMASSANGTTADRTETVGDAPVKVEKALTATETLNTFKDHDRIDKMKWPADAIAKLAAAKIVAGTPEGKFEPERNMTRAEFIKVLVTAFGFDMKQTATPTFKDVKKTDWFYDYIETAVKYSIASGSTDQGARVFLPNSPISRAEMASILYHAMIAKFGQPSLTQKELPFSDVVGGYWAKDAISYLYQNGYAAGKDAQHFAPGDFTTRAEVSVVLAKMMK